MLGRGICNHLILILMFVNTCLCRVLLHVHHEESYPNRPADDCTREDGEQPL